MGALIPTSAAEIDSTTARLMTQLKTVLVQIEENYQEFAGEKGSLTNAQWAAQLGVDVTVVDAWVTAWVAAKAARDLIYNSPANIAALRRVS